MIGDELGRSHLLVAEFRVLVDVASPGDQLLFDSLRLRPHLRFQPNAVRASPGIGCQRCYG